MRIKRHGGRTGSSPPPRIALLADGNTATQVAALTGASHSSIKKWSAALAKGGTAALAAKPHPLHEGKLDLVQKAELVETLVRGPLARGYLTNLWTCRRVAVVVQKRFGVSYHPDHLGRILHDLGFTPQKPEQLARERDEVAITRWRKHDWPRVKKGLAAAALPWLS